MILSYIYLFKKSLITWLPQPQWDFSNPLTFPWPTELKFSWLSPNNGLNLRPPPPSLTGSSSPSYLCFQQITCSVHELVVLVVQKGLIFIHWAIPENIRTIPSTAFWNSRALEGALWSGNLKARGFQIWNFQKGQTRVYSLKTPILLTWPVHK